MPRTKKTVRTKKTAAKRTLPDSRDIESPSVEAQTDSAPSQKPVSLLSWRNFIILAVLIIALLVWRFRGYFIVATVNGQPVSRWELNDQLVRRFGEQSLDNIINERLILAGARQKGIFVTSDEIQNKIKEVETQLSGRATLKEALDAQGMTEDMFRRQIEIQLSIEKMFDKEASISSKEIDDYVAQNAELYKEATEPAKVKEEASGVIKQQKISDLFDKWFAEVKKNATIKRYL